MTTDSSELLLETNRVAAQFAIVTGASTGIGLSLAFECASHGYDLLMWPTSSRSTRLRVKSSK